MLIDFSPFISPMSHRSLGEVSTKTNIKFITMNILVLSYAMLPQSKVNMTRLTFF